MTNTRSKQVRVVGRERQNMCSQLSYWPRYFVPVHTGGHVRRGSLHFSIDCDISFIIAAWHDASNAGGSSLAPTKIIIVKELGSWAVWCRPRGKLLIELL